MTLKIFKTELINVLKEYQEYLNENLAKTHQHKYRNILTRITTILTSA